jgi:hypothetical protein
MMISPTSLLARTSRSRSSKRLRFQKIKLSRNLPALLSALSLVGTDRIRVSVKGWRRLRYLFVASGPQELARRDRKEHMVLLSIPLLAGDIT